MYDVVAVFLSIVGAFALRFDANDVYGHIRPYLPVAVLPLLIQPLVNVGFGLYRREWRYASVREMFGIVAAVASGTLASTVLFVVVAEVNVPGASGMPRSFFPLQGLLALTLIGGGRFAIRALLETSGRSGGTDEESEGVRTLVFGAGDAGAAVTHLSERDRSTGISVVGFLDDDPRKHGSRLMGRRILGGIDDIPNAARRTRAQQLLVAMPSASGAIVRAVVEAGRQVRLAVRVVPPLTELLADPDRIVRIRPVSLDDLLRREPVRADIDRFADYLNGMSVLVTGGGGSIGSELCRQILAAGPRRITVIDSSEHALWKIERELNERRVGQGWTVDAFLADVRSESGLRQAMTIAAPDVVFHAAALKHVPICEAQPAEAFLTNVVGTQNVLALSEELGVGRFALISTDKAVRAVGVMGATKLLAEMLTSAAARRMERPYVAVRFGNVLGSSGSVVPIFQAQMEAGRPITITHPDATRYFMTIPEAVTLILEATSDPGIGETYILEMGEPIRILDLARDVARLSGIDPATLDIVYTGLRPGERLHEELLLDHETVARTRFDRIFRALHGQETQPTALGPLVEELSAYALRHDNKRLRERMLQAGLIHVPVAATPIL